MRFQSNLRYHDRESKASFVHDKYASILHGNVLDVGADAQFLKKLLPESVVYAGIGLGGAPGLQLVDLEKEGVPFKSESFDCVVCLDVLEHLDNIHDVFDDLCRVSRRWVLISLPNPWADMISVLQNSQYKPGRNTKFYGLPPKREQDRHKWFFSSSEAQEFITFRASKNEYQVVDAYTENKDADGLPGGLTMRNRVKRNAFRILRRMYFRDGLHYPDLYEGTSWWVLKKNNKNINA